MEEIKFCKIFLIKFFFMIVFALLYQGNIFGQSASNKTNSDYFICDETSTSEQATTYPYDMSSGEGFNDSYLHTRSLTEFSFKSTNADSVKHTNKSGGKKHKQKATKKNKSATKSVTLPPSKLNICKYGFAYVGFKEIHVTKLKVKVSGKSVKKAKVLPNDKQIVLVAGKDYGISVVTVTGKIIDSTGSTSFTQKITVTVVECKKPKPNQKDKGKSPENTPNGGNIATKNICEGDSYYYTLHITAKDGSNTLIHVNVQSSNTDIATANYDSPSQTVSGTGVKQGQAIITVTGEVEDDAADQDISFTVTITVNVMKCVSIEVCKGKTVFVQMDNASNANSSNQGVATAAIAPKGINVTGVNAGTATINITNSDNNPSGKITVTVKKCPPPKIDSVKAAFHSPFYEIPCFYIGGEIIKNWGDVRTTETWNSTDQVTNQFDDSGDPFGAGIIAGYNFLQRNNIIAGSLVSFDFMNQTINRNFGSSTYIGTTTHWIFNADMKGGFVTSPNIFIYGIAGIALLNQDLNINFGGPITSNNTTVFGFAFGIGGEYQPAFLQNFGRDISLSLQVQHTWWLNSNLNNPAASPGFNYTFYREDNTIKLGVNVYLWQAKP